MRSQAGWAAVALLAAWAAWAAPPIAPTGQLIEVTGPVEMRRAGQPAVTGGVALPLRPGDVLVVGDGGSAQVVLFGRNSGTYFALTSRSRAIVQGETLARQAGTPPRLIKRITLPSPPAAGERILGLVVRGNANAGPYDPSPVGTIRDSPVILRWKGPVEAAEIEVRLSTVGQLLQQATLPAKAREFRVPEGMLKPGETYTWSAVAFDRMGDRVAGCQGWLRILLPDEQETLEAVRKSLAADQEAEPQSPAPLALLAAVYQRLEMFAEARASYRELLERHPEATSAREALEALDRSPPAPAVENPPTGRMPPKQ